MSTTARAYLEALARRPRPISDLAFLVAIDIAIAAGGPGGSTGINAALYDRDAIADLVRAGHISVRSDGVVVATMSARFYDEMIAPYV